MTYDSPRSVTIFADWRPEFLGTEEGPSKESTEANETLGKEFAEVEK